MLTGCALWKSTAVTIDPSTLCLFLERPEWSAKDTEPTQKWMENYAVRYDRLKCG